MLHRVPTISRHTTSVSRSLTPFINSDRQKLFSRNSVRSYHSTLPSCVDTKQIEGQSNILKKVNDEVFSKLKENLENSTLYVCVSGGLDSVALLRMLVQTKQQALKSEQPSIIPHFDIEVIHFNHNLRPESEIEFKFVKELAERFDIPFHYRVCEKELAASWKDKGGLQQHARNWRMEQSHQLMLEQAEKEGLLSSKQFLVTGHHLDDGIETLFMKLLRGVHLSHIKGIDMLATQSITLSDSTRGDDSANANHEQVIKATKSIKQEAKNVSYSSKLQIFRPFVTSVSKQELTDYLKMLNQSWMEDVSNQQTIYKRNLVRLELLPLLEKVAGGEQALKERVRNLESQSSSLRSWLESEADQWEREHHMTTLTNRPLTNRPHFDDSLEENEGRGSNSHGDSGSGFHLSLYEPSPHVLPLRAWLPLPTPVQTEVLHRFVERANNDFLKVVIENFPIVSSSSEKLSRGVSISYSQIEQLQDQIKSNTRNQWKHSLSRYYYAERVGDVLKCGCNVENMLTDSNVDFPIRTSKHNQQKKKLYLPLIEHGETTIAQDKSNYMLPSTGNKTALKPKSYLWPVVTTEAVENFMKQNKLKLFIMPDKNGKGKYDLFISLFAADENKFLTMKLISDVECVDSILGEEPRISVRRIQSGDHFVSSPINKESKIRKKKVKDILRELAVPLHLRSQTLIFTRDDVVMAMVCGESHTIIGREGKILGPFLK